MDWESLYCPNRHGWYDGRPFFQDTHGQEWQYHGQKQARCGLRNACVNQDMGPLLGTCTQPAIFETACGMSGRPCVRATARLVQSTRGRVVHGWIERPTLSIVLLYLLARPSCHRMPAGRTLELCGHTKQHHVPCARLSDETYGEHGSGSPVHRGGGSCLPRDW